MLPGIIEKSLLGKIPLLSAYIRYMLTRGTSRMWEYNSVSREEEISDFNGAKNSRMDKPIKREKSAVLPVICLAIAFALFLAVIRPMNFKERKSVNRLRDEHGVRFQRFRMMIHRYQGAEKLLVTGAVSPVTIFSRVA